MDSRYFAKVVNVQDEYTVVINAGANQGVKIGDNYLIVGLGPEILDPDTNEPLERLELVRGRVSVSHVQEKISTLKSSEKEREADTKQIKKVTSKGSATSLLAGLYGTPGETITESITPGTEIIRPLKKPAIGDYVLKR